MTAVLLWLTVMTVTLRKLVRNRGALALLHPRSWTGTSEKSFEKEEEPQLAVHGAVGLCLVGCPSGCWETRTVKLLSEPPKLLSFSLR